MIEARVLPVNGQSATKADHGIPVGNTPNLSSAERHLERYRLALVVTTHRDKVPRTERAASGRRSGQTPAATWRISVGVPS